MDTVADLHPELVSAGRCEPFCGGREGFDVVFEPGDGFGCAADGLLHAPLVAFPGGVEALEALEVAVGVGQVEQQERVELLAYAATRLAAANTRGQVES